jgi:hypothetical protein
MEEVPEMDAHSPREFRNDMLTCGSWEMSVVFPELVLVWKIRSTPLFSYAWLVSRGGKRGGGEEGILL